MSESLDITQYFGNKQTHFKSDVGKLAGSNKQVGFNIKKEVKEQIIKF